MTTEQSQIYSNPSPLLAVTEFLYLIMKAVSEALEPHQEWIGIVASVVTIGHFFSGAFVCKDIYKKQTTTGNNAIPFIGGVTIGTLMLQYAIILDDIAMLQVHAAAIFLNVIYVGFYYLYCSEKWNEIFKPFAWAVGLVAVLIAYTTYEDHELVEMRYGLIIAILMLLLLGSPLIEVKSIVREKDASSIPFPMTFMGAMATFLWFIYGIIILDHFLVIQNVIGFVLCLVQLVLCFLYPGPQNKFAQKKKKKQGKKHKFKHNFSKT